MKGNTRLNQGHHGQMNAVVVRVRRWCILTLAIWLLPCAVVASNGALEALN